MRRVEFFENYPYMIREMSELAQKFTFSMKLTPFPFIVFEKNGSFSLHTLNDIFPLPFCPFCHLPYYA